MTRLPPLGRRPCGDGWLLNATDTLQWIGPEALLRVERDASLCAWLRTPGLLTQQVRVAAGAAFRFEALREYSTSAAHVREVALRAGATVWVVGRSTIPREGLQHAAWLAEVGSIPIGEALQARQGTVDRSPFEFCRMPADHEFARLALMVMALEVPRLWVRRSVFDVDGARLEVQEAFNPSIGAVAMDSRPVGACAGSQRNG